MAGPALYVFDCSAAGVVIPSLTQYADQHMSNPDVRITACFSVVSFGYFSFCYFELLFVGFAGGCLVATKLVCCKITFVVCAVQNAGLIGNVRDAIVLCACSANEVLPFNMRYPADVFTSCLTTPIKMALRWYTLSRERFASSLWRSRIIAAY